MALRDLVGGETALVVLATTDRDDRAGAASRPTIADPHVRQPRKPRAVAAAAAAALLVVAVLAAGVAWLAGADTGASAPETSAFLYEHRRRDLRPATARRIAAAADAGSAALVERLGRRRVELTHRRAYTAVPVGGAGGGLAQACPIDLPA